MYERLINVKQVKLKDVNANRWKAKKSDQQAVDRGLSTLAITKAMDNLDKTIEKMDNVLTLNLEVSQKLLTAVETLTKKINPS